MIPFTSQWEVEVISTIQKVSLSFFLLDAAGSFDDVVGGFEPMFFLHHANVDRLLALW